MRMESEMTVAMKKLKREIEFAIEVFVRGHQGWAAGRPSPLSKNTKSAETLIQVKGNDQSDAGTAAVKDRGASMRWRSVRK
jgi:hypothetical protein